MSVGMDSSGDTSRTWVLLKNEACSGSCATAAAPPPALVVTAVSVEGSNLRFTLATTAGRIYAIESRAGLASGAWEEVPGTRQTSAGAAFEMRLPIHESQLLQFFRVKQFTRASISSSSSGKLGTET